MNGLPLFDGWHVLLCIACYYLAMRTIGAWRGTGGWPERQCKHAIGVCPHCPDPDEEDDSEELLDEARKALRSVVRILVHATRRTPDRLALQSSRPDVHAGAEAALAEFDRAGELCYKAGVSPMEQMPEEWFDACEAIAGLVVPWLARDIAWRYTEESPTAACEQGGQR